MTANEILTWVRGPAMQFAIVIFCLGIVIRILEMWMLGRSTDLSVARKSGFLPGLRTVFHRSIPAPGLLKREPLVYLGGYTFHLGFFITLIFFAPHIQLFYGMWGIRWPGLPASLIDFIAVVSIAALIALLAHRIVHPVRRYLSNVGDYVSWLVTFLPLLTGYMVAHESVLPYAQMLTIHILSVELLLIVLPFTKLTHSFTLFLSRWYNGAMAGRKGVAS